MSAVLQAMPLVVTLGSALFLGEKVGWRRWTAILFGLVGVVVMLSPGADGFNAWIVLPLICAVLGAIYGIATRLVSRDDQPSTSFFYLAIVGFIQEDKAEKALGAIRRSRRDGR